MAVWKCCRALCRLCTRIALKATARRKKLWKSVVAENALPVNENRFETDRVSPCAPKVSKCFDFKATFHPEWHNKKDISVSRLSEWNVCLDPQQVFIPLVLKTSERFLAGCNKWQISIQRLNFHPLWCQLSRSGPHRRLCSYPAFAHINSSVNREFRQREQETQDHSAHIFKASSATAAAIAWFLFVCLMFKVAVCCSRLPGGSISTVYVAPSAPSHSCLMSERYH